jgi:hypothetical protein
MNIFYKLFLIYLGLFLVACDSQNRMSMYRCEDYANYAHSCEHCTLDKKFNLQFLVSKEHSSVMQIIFYDGLQTGSITHKECTIFNDKNWDCSQDFTNNPRSILKISNGRLTSVTEFWNKEKFESRDGICSK